MTETDHEDDDGAVEVVAERPMRAGVAPVTPGDIVTSPAGGRMKALSDAGDRHRREFVLLRKAGHPAVKIALPHAPVFKGLWSLWAAKRAAGSDDPGVTAPELTSWLAERGIEATISTAIRSLSRGGAVRTVVHHVGFAATRVRYYPTDEGVQTFALAETLGLGAMVQVGATPAWKRRDAGEPKNLFHYASLLRGGRSAPIPEIA
jgi:hypothetical protein